MAAVVALGQAFAAPAPIPTAIEQLSADRAAVAEAVKRSDWPAYLAHARRLRAFLNDAPASRLEVARAQLRAGDRAAALAETKAFLALGLTHPILAAPAFAPIAADIAPLVAANQAPVTLGTRLFRLADASLVTEDIDFARPDGPFFISAILGRRIVKTDGYGDVRLFADAPDGWPVQALKLDVKRRRLWASEVALNGFATVPKADWGRSAVLEYDLDGARLLARIEGPGGGALGDMALAPDGTPIVSDGTRGGVYRVSSGALVRIDHGDFVSPQTPAFCGDANIAFVPDYVRGLARLDLRTGRVRWFSGERHALTGIDGLYCRGHTLVAVQNGVAPERIVAFQLDTAETAVVDEQVIERATPTLGEPTHGVLLGRTFLYLANSGWDALGDDGAVKSGAKLTAPVVMRFDLPR